MELIKTDKDLGSFLVKQAQEKRQKELQEQAVAEVTTIVQQIENAEREIEKANSVLELAKKRLAAVESGAIKVIKLYSGNLAIAYNDVDLNPPHVSIELAKNR